MVAPVQCPDGAGSQSPHAGAGRVGVSARSHAARPEGNRSIRRPRTTSKEAYCPGGGAPGRRRGTFGALAGSKFVSGAFMAKKPNHIRWIIALGAIAFVGVLVYSSFQQTKERYEVCMTFKGGAHCATAAGSNYDQAVRSAQEIDCELLANGRDENIACLAQAPSSVRPIR